MEIDKGFTTSFDEEIIFYGMRIRSSMEYHFNKKEEIKLITPNDIKKVKENLEELGCIIKKIRITVDNISHNEKKIANKDIITNTLGAKKYDFTVKEIGKNSLIVSKLGDDHYTFKLRNLNYLKFDTRIETTEYEFQGKKYKGCNFIEEENGMVCNRISKVTFTLLPY